MAAVKKLVYEDKVFTMDQLVKMLEADFEGYEVERQILINNAPKYGNDDPYVDNIAKEMMDFSYEVTSSYKNLLGYSFVTGNVPSSPTFPTAKSPARCLPAAKPVRLWQTAYPLTPAMIRTAPPPLSNPSAPWITPSPAAAIC